MNTGTPWNLRMIEKDLELERSWQKLRVKLKEAVGRKPKDLNGVLFLIGVQELGKGNISFTKEFLYLIYFSHSS